MSWFYWGIYKKSTMTINKQIKKKWSQWSNKINANQDFENIFAKDLEKFSIIMFDNKIKKN